MKDNLFQKLKPAIRGNPKLRTPQLEAFGSLVDLAHDSEDQEREVGVILPVGCGKSGCITLTPFAFGSTRTLVVAPNVKIADQLYRDFNPSNRDAFYQKCGILSARSFPEPVRIQGRTSNRSDLEEADVVVTNIQQLQGPVNRWLEDLPDDFFDLILFDEGHHNVADSWESLRRKFGAARIVNFSATPHRADGRLMAGEIIYSYPVYRAIQEGYVKKLTGVILKPSSLRYVRREDDAEVTVDLDEVRRLGEEDAGFRRSIVTAPETLNTIVDASIRKLEELRAHPDGSGKLKIIASALNFEHCRQIVEAYRSRGLKADYIHSRESSEANQRVVRRLENHDLDVIVQVRKLGEGFDHPYLAVAAVFSIFSNLSPFVQFVGRIMRVIKQDAPDDPLNRGAVVFHAGANIAQRWTDFQEYSEADQAFFDQLLPLEDLDFDSGDELESDPMRDGRDLWKRFEINAQSEVQMEEIPLIRDDQEALDALRLLQQKGYTPDDMKQAYEELEPVPTTKVQQRQAKRVGLDQRVREETGRILGGRAVNPEGRNLDRQFRNRSNFVVLKSAIDRRANAIVGRSTGTRHDFTQEELDRIESAWADILARAEQEVFGDAAT